MSEPVIHQFPCREDNYGVLVHDPETGSTVAIDAPDAVEIERQLEEKGWQLSHILTTHHHGDHTAGNAALKARTGCTIVGPGAEAHCIPALDRGVVEGDVLGFAGHEVRVMETPGHTAGHVSYWWASINAAFVGDTLFAMGCGRVFEGSYETMWASLGKIAALPPSTRLYCGHEYTVANARFALTIEPDNAALRQRARECEALRAEGQPTLPTVLELERATNPFLRAGIPAIKERMGLPAAPDWEVFAALRERKNRA